MTPTDKLRTLLDERGVEYDPYGGDFIKKTCWKSDGIAYEYTEVVAQGGTHCEFRAPRREGVTPEQAIAATAGAGTCEGEIDTDYFECRLTWFECRGCGWSGVVDNVRAGYSFDGTDMPRHCPNCGRKVTE